jgi:hypothetical protein
LRETISTEEKDIRLFRQTRKRNRNEKEKRDKQALSQPLHSIVPFPSLMMPIGPCDIAEPSLFSVADRAKWEAWKACGSMLPERARRMYVGKLAALSTLPSTADVRAFEEAWAEWQRVHPDEWRALLSSSTSHAATHRRSASLDSACLQASDTVGGDTRGGQRGAAVILGAADPHPAAPGGDAAGGAPKEGLAGVAARPNGARVNSGAKGRLPGQSKRTATGGLPPVASDAATAASPSSPPSASFVFGATPIQDAKSDTHGPMAGSAAGRRASSFPLRLDTADAAEGHTSGKAPTQPAAYPQATPGPSPGGLARAPPSAAQRTLRLPSPQTTNGTG